MVMRHSRNRLVLPKVRDLRELKMTYRSVRCVGSRIRAEGPRIPQPNYPNEGQNGIKMLRFETQRTLRQTLVLGIQGQADPILHPELGINVVEMDLHRSFFDVKVVRDFPVIETLGHQTHQRYFPQRQRLNGLS